MKIAIVSDVHGNFAALEAVVTDLQRISPDLTVHGGDLALSGPKPAECLDLIRELGWPGVAGNTDEVLWKKEGAHVYLGVAIQRLAAATRDLIGDESDDLLPLLPL